MKAVAKALEGLETAGLTVEEAAEKVIAAYEAVQATSHNLIVLAEFRPLTGAGPAYLSAVGPLSTRAVKAAREVGERFAWDYKTRKGTGRFMLVPLVRHPHEAWDAARDAELVEYEHHLSAVTPGVEPTYEPMRFELPEAVRASITAEWQADTETLAPKLGPQCLCGLARDGGVTCLRHPDRREGGET